MLRTEDEITRSYGVNLLQGLTGLFSNSRIRTSGVDAVIDTRGIGGAASSATIAPLIYSLNIANATNNRNEVIARPSLLAIDRTPSTFFSGTTLSIAVGGAAGSVNQLIDKPIGVSLSITPTIIDDENILLAIKVARSFVQIPAVGVSGAAVSTSRNSVSANITAKFGQTIILSGLTERELMRSDSGVPVLKDIPGVQYMFDKTTSVDFFRTVMVMITPRKPVTDSSDIDGVKNEKKERALGISPTKKYQFHWRVEEYENILNKYAPNLDSVLDTLETNKLYQGFKSKDLIDTNWSTMPKMQQLLQDLKLLLVR